MGMHTPTILILSEVRTNERKGKTEARPRTSIRLGKGNQKIEKKKEAEERRKARWPANAGNNI